MCWFANLVLEAIVLFKQRKQYSQASLRLAMIALGSDMLLSSNWALNSKSQYLAPWQIVILGCMSSGIIFSKSWFERAAEEDKAAKSE
jgi:hypothetical protein